MRNEREKTFTNNRTKSEYEQHAHDNKRANEIGMISENEIIWRKKNMNNIELFSN